MTDTQVDTLYKTTVNEYADMLRAADFSEVQIESYLDEAMKTTGIENQKSAIAKLQGEMGIKQQEALTIDETNVFKNELNDDKIDTNRPSVFSTNQEVFDSLEHTDFFESMRIFEHIFLGEVNSNGNVTGCHFENMPKRVATIVEGTRSAPDQNGIYSAVVEINGKRKIGNNGESTFFPLNWKPQQVVDAINEAYDSKELVKGKRYQYIGETKEGLSIIMYLNKQNKITSAYPEYDE